jgi:hypothetical protein
MLAGPALSAFAIFHSSECADVVNIPGGNGAVAEERSSRSSLAPAVKERPLRDESRDEPDAGKPFLTAKAIDEIAANPLVALLMA